MVSVSEKVADSRVELEMASGVGDRGVTRVRCDEESRDSSVPVILPSGPSNTSSAQPMMGSRTSSGIIHEHPLRDKVL